MFQQKVELLDIMSLYHSKRIIFHIYCSCENVNFSFRENCNKCGQGKPSPPPTLNFHQLSVLIPCVLPLPSEKGKVDFFKKTGAEIGKQAAKKSGGLFSAEDWQCVMYVHVLI